MPFPLRPSSGGSGGDSISSNKSGRLTHQANVSGPQAAHSPDPLYTATTTSISADLLNPQSTLLLRSAELPKPMSRLPEIRLESGGGNKVQVAQVKPQKSCESYDSTASGLSWSSSQSTHAIGSSCGNSISLSGNPSFSGYDDYDLNQSKVQYSTRQEATPPRINQGFKKGQSFEEERTTNEKEKKISSEAHNEVQESNNTPSKDCYDSVFEENVKEVEEECESGAASRDTGKRKSFRKFWKLAYKAIRNDGSGNDAITQSGLSKKNSETEEPEEIDPVYQLLKSAATQRQISTKNSTIPESSDPAKRPPRLNSSSRANSLVQK